ncbi:MAG: nuclear transport factor 2 family protein [Deltaproteobacteria bacterium]
MTGQLKDQVLKANEKFYSALGSGDLELMREVWVRDSKARCVHPGWPMLYGWDAVMESWKKIFEEGGPAGIEVSDVRIRISGNLAWVVCIEKISQRVDEEIRSGYAQSTNVFEYRDSSWLLVIHHASPVPVPRGEGASDHSLQ